MISRLTPVALAAAVAAPLAPAARADVGAQPMPIIVTYELKKQREADRVMARDPRKFWIRQIVARIEDRKRDLGKAMAQPVTVEVTFVVAHDGRLVSKALVKPSGNALADRTAVAMLDQAAPFPPMPAAMPDADLTFNLPVRFR